MVGHMRPIARDEIINRFARSQHWLGRAWRILLCLTLLSMTLLAESSCAAAEKTVRLRLAWGSGTAAKQRWHGTISIDGAVLTDLQPLGIETDSSVAIRIDGNRLIVNPLLARGFDGCDVTVRADEQASMRVDLNSNQSPVVVTFEKTLFEVVESQAQQALDQFGSYFLARRSPGDTLRVIPTREHLVFAPNERWTLKIQPDLKSQLSEGPILLDFRLFGVAEDKLVLQTTKRITEMSELDEPIAIDLDCPSSEGAYRLEISAKPEEGLATRFLPGQQTKPIAEREVEFVVIDPNAKLAPLVDSWLPVLTIDPANPSWWQRLPAWAQVPRLRSRSPGVVGNVKPVVRPGTSGEIVELPAAPDHGDPYWQSYTLPVRQPGEPHLIEIEYPSGVEQAIDIALVEPDAAGRVNSAGQFASLVVDGFATPADGSLKTYRFMVWPQSKMPQLLLVNRHKKLVASYGKIKLSRQDGAIASLTEAEPLSPGERTLAAYVSRPDFTSAFGAIETLDEESGLSVTSWSTFLDATTRLTQAIRFNGYNSVMLSVAADGSALYPSGFLMPSPRYDTGMLAASGQDPLRKDVLEMMLRVFDREGIRVVPTVQLAAPLPQLESIRHTISDQESGIACVDHDGRRITDKRASDAGLAPYYNLLNARVQGEVSAVINELAARYGHHSSFKGVGVQLSGQGYGLLPNLGSGFDDQTIGKFSADTGVAVPAHGVGRFQQRARLLLGTHQRSWRRWRQDRITEFYLAAANRMQSVRSDLKLTLATEELFTGFELETRIRKAVANSTGIDSILKDHAIDFAALRAEPSIHTLSPRFATGPDSVHGNAIIRRINAAADRGELAPATEPTADLHYDSTDAYRLASFDALCPFGPDQSLVSVNSRHSAIGDGRRSILATTLAVNTPAVLVQGTIGFNLNVDSTTRDINHTIRQLPSSEYAVRTQRAQPAILRVFRTTNSTVVALINESPWRANVKIELLASRSGPWKKLGAGQAEEGSQFVGNTQRGTDTWAVELRPYDVQAWRFEDEQLRVGEVSVVADELAKTSLESRIADIEARAGNLNVERPYRQLQNPSFELQDGGVRIVGWQPRYGSAGTVTLDEGNPRSGLKALRLSSADRTGVAVQSHLFPNPQTGQLMVSAYLKNIRVDDHAELRIAVHDAGGGDKYQQFAVLNREQLSSDEWTRFEFPLNDVPIGEGEQLRIHFHLAGKAEILIDDVALCDLRFDDARRRSVVKRIYGANIALQQGQLIDCMHAVDDYWSKYVLEHVPPSKAVESVAAGPTTPPEATNEQSPTSEDKGFKSRVRGWVPKIWR